MSPTVLARGKLAGLDGATRDALLARGGDDPLQVLDAVLPIRDAVLNRGDDALLELTDRFDGVRPPNLLVPRARWRDALELVDPDLRDALQGAARRIRTFHEAQLPIDREVDVAPGLRAGRRVVPVARAGCYVPGGRAAYPSTVLMTVVPARVAGVADITVCTPPGPDGSPPDVVLAACEVAGATRVAAVGGAQAVFAMAHGTASIPRADVIVGPGNRYVAAAKALVAGRVATDAPAGPSEVLVVADATAAPGAVARELAAQAEHDPDAAALLVSLDPDLPDAVAKALDEILDATPRAEVVRESLARRGALLTAASPDEAAAFVDAYAPEHLALHVDEPRKVLATVSNYGSAFLGAGSPVAMGDYGAGPNHVLPTAGLARGRSGLDVRAFLRTPTHLSVDPDEAAMAVADAARLAEAEGLAAHRDALRALVPGGGDP